MLGRECDENTKIASLTKSSINVSSSVGNVSNAGGAVTFSISSVMSADSEVRSPAPRLR